MPALDLTPAERRAHRAAAHHLDPVVAIGAGGLTAAVIGEVDAALRAHGLVKIRVHADDRAAREDILARLAATLEAAPVQHIGKLLVLWRPLAPTARSEAGTGRAPRLVKVVTPGSEGRRPTLRRVRLLGNQRVTAGGLVKRAKPARPASVKKKAQR